MTCDNCGETFEELWQYKPYISLHQYWYCEECFKKIAIEGEE